MEQVVFAHIADAHFADVDLIDKAGGGTGPKGHQLLLCRALPSALRDIRKQAGVAPAEALPVVLAGDLTRTGAEKEFAVGLEYLCAGWRNRSNRPGRRFGLNLASHGLLMVPGDHDHWDGDPVRRPAWGRAAHRYFRRTAWKEEVSSPAGRLIVEFYGVDSCAGLGEERRLSNRTACGRIATRELDALETELAESTQRGRAENGAVRRVRVLVCHHSLQGNAPLSWCRGALGFDERSRAELLELAGRYRVAAILTGHAHDMLADRYATPHGQPPHVLREFRSPATLQGEARWGLQGLFGHRVWLDATGQIRWTALPYRWQGNYFYPLSVDEGEPAAGQWNPLSFRVN